MSLPSVKTLERAFPGQGIEIRNLLEGKVMTTEYKSVIDLCARCLHYPSYPHRLMTALNEILEGFGIEVIRPKDFTEHYSYEHVNMGDTYVTTIMRRSDGKIVVASVGDIVEKHSDWYL